MKTETITVIIPCFNEEEALPVYYQAMQPVMKQMENIDFELLVIDDGSTDHTLLEMKALHQKDPRCKYFSFSRNFGKEAAIYAGLSNAGGDYVAVMDVDLQDPLSLLPKMYKILLEEEYDSVATRRSDRAGETKWSLRKLFVYSMEGITGFSVAPLSLASVLGLLFCLVSFVMIIVIIVRTLIWGDPVSGWPSLACIIFMVSGVQLLCTGIVGQYLSKTYLETKHRPIFFLKDSSEEETRTHYEYEHKMQTMADAFSFDSFHFVFLLVILREIWCIRLKSRLDQPAQRISGLFPTAVL